MMRYVLVAMLLFGSSASADLLQQYCVKCHTQKRISLQKSFMNALLIYGGEKNMKAGLIYYFQNPNRETSVMDEEYLEQYGVKKPLEIPTDLLTLVLDEYWQKYTVIGKLK